MIDQSDLRHRSRLMMFIAAVQLLSLVVMVHLWWVDHAPVHQPHENPQLTQAAILSTVAVRTGAPNLQVSVTKNQAHEDVSGIFLALSKSIAIVGVSVNRVKMQTNANNQLPAVVVNIVSTYVQYKDFLRYALRVQPKLVIRKLTAQRMSMPSGVVSFEATFAVLPDH